MTTQIGGRRCGHVLLGLIALAFVLPGQMASECDTEAWKEAKSRYKLCLKTNSEQLHTLTQLQSDMTLATCRLMEQILQCSEMLTDCLQSHFNEAEKLLFSSSPLDASWSRQAHTCQTMLMEHELALSRSKRAASKTSDTRSGGKLSQVQQVGKDIVSSVIRSKVPGQKTGHGGTLAKLAGVSGLAGTGHQAKAGSSSSGGVLKKVGKYAVAGLAAYGTYKAAKSLGKGVKSLYDQDHCWLYDSRLDHYSCNCNQPCQVYVNTAMAITINSHTIFVTLLILIFGQQLAPV